MVVEASPTHQYFIRGHEGEARNYSLTGRVAVTQPRLTPLVNSVPTLQRRLNPIFSPVFNRKGGDTSLFLFICLFIKLHKQAK